MNFSVNEVSFPCNDTISWYRKDQGSAQVLTLIKISNETSHCSGKYLKKSEKEGGVEIKP